MRRALVALVAALAVLASGCGAGDGVTVRARFADVGSLATDAPVMMNDVKVGEVADIRLDGYQALVTIELDPEADVPRDVQARVRSTSLLGERIVDLVIPEGLRDDAPRIQDGAVIAQTAVRSELEDLVREGTDVLAPIAASEVATLVDEGARGFGGRGEDLRSLLGDLRDIVRAYAARTGDVRSVIASLNQLNSTLARKAEDHARAVGNSARGIGMLEEEGVRLERAVRSLARLARGARGIFDEHSDEMHRFFRQIRVIAAVLASEQRTIVKLLRYAPRHNRNTQAVEYEEFNQIFQDFVICGFNDDPRDAARRCRE